MNKIIPITGILITLFATGCNVMAISRESIYVCSGKHEGDVCKVNENGHRFTGACMLGEENFLACLPLR